MVSLMVSLSALALLAMFTLGCGSSAEPDIKERPTPTAELDASPTADATKEYLLYPCPNGSVNKRNGNWTRRKRSGLSMMHGSNLTNISYGQRRSAKTSLDPGIVSLSLRS